MELDNQPDDDLKLSPLLENLRHKNPFQVPQDYFKRTEDKIMDKMRESKKVKIFSLHHLPKIGIGMAASLLLGIGIYTFLSTTSPQKMSSSDLREALKSLPKDEVNDYIIMNSNSLNNDLIAQTLDLNRQHFELNIKGLDSTTIDKYIDDIDEQFLTEQN
jgi:deoxyhypusine synthase